MKDKKLTIVINKPVKDVFDFTLDPANTPQWVSSIVQEMRNETPTKLGTIYKNQNNEGEWSEYELTEFELNKGFVMSQKNGSYHVKYTFTSVGENQTELEYYEYVDNGEIAEPFTQDVLQKLKDIMEQ
jgi:hypothetical protein